MYTEICWFSDRLQIIDFLQAIVEQVLLHSVAIAQGVHYMIDYRPHLRACTHSVYSLYAYDRL